MKKVIINKITLWYNRKLCSLFYDYKMTKQFPVSSMNKQEYESFLSQVGNGNRKANAHI